MSGFAVEQGLNYGHSATMKSDPKLNYPVFLIESNRFQKFTGFNVVKNRFDFTVFGRVPNAVKFSGGSIFTCDGRCYTYQGSAGWPRFSPRLCVLLDSLLVPGLIYKLAETFIYFGPKPVSSAKLDLNSFKSAIIDSIENYDCRTQPQLRKVVATKGSFREVIEGIEWWSYHGGVRDADGHPHNNPEYSP
jgi:hypothetical protein